jgi:hypothetical protein
VPGPAGIVEAWWSGKVDVHLPPSETSVARISRSFLSPGSYLVYATARLRTQPSQATPSDQIECLLRGVDGQSMALTSGERSQSSMGSVNVPAPGPLELLCRSSFAKGPADVEVYAWAIKVTTMH